MPDFQNPPEISANNQPPPGGDQQRAESYIKQLVQLLSENKLLASHTDLTKFDPSALQDHYRVDIKNYQLEISHSKQPTTAKDTYVLLFLNSSSVDDFYNAHGIIAYLILNDDQFKRFKAIADEQIETRRKVEEEKRFAKAVKPIEELLEKISKGELNASKTEPAPVEVKVEEPSPPPPEPEKTKTINPPPVLEDIQKALDQIAKNPTVEEKTEREPNLDIPRVETLPTPEETISLPNPVLQSISPPSEPATLQPDSFPKPIVTEPSLPTPVDMPPVATQTLSETLSPVAMAPIPIETSPTQSKEPTPQTPVSSSPPETLLHLDSMPKNTLTENTPTGSNALPPSGIDQAIDQAFQKSGNNSISSQTPPIGIS